MFSKITFSFSITLVNDMNPKSHKNQNNAILAVTIVVHYANWIYNIICKTKHGEEDRFRESFCYDKNRNETFCK